ncbi:hypothetical protein FACS189425_06670 [Clostridia bacterium]|nr:hypothetical protein FACS189425_06670 [Clostridia bacterium]
MYQGNLAYKIEAPEIRKIIKGKSVKRPEPTHKSRTIAQILVVFAILFGLCWRYVAIYDQSSEISHLKTQLANLQAVNSQIQMEIESATEKNKLDTYAKDVLGMREPDKSQYVYVTLRQQDEMEAIGDTAAKKDTKGAMASIGGMLEYFK